MLLTAPEYRKRKKLYAFIKQGKQAFKYDIHYIYLYVGFRTRTKLVIVEKLASETKSPKDFQSIPTIGTYVTYIPLL